MVTDWLRSHVITTVYMCAMMVLATVTHIVT